MSTLSSHSLQSAIPSKVLTKCAIEAALAKKAEDVLVMDVHEVSGLADYFVLCSGGTSVHIKTIQESIEEHVRSHAHENPWHREGQEFRQWVLLDYVDVVVHIFSRERRAFFNLERLWNDAPQELVNDGYVAMLE